MRGQESLADKQQSRLRCIEDILDLLFPGDTRHEFAVIPELYQSLLLKYCQENSKFREPRLVLMRITNKDRLLGTQFRGEIVEDVNDFFFAFNLERDLQFR